MPSKARQLPVATALAYPESNGSWKPIPQPIRSALVECLAYPPDLNHNYTRHVVVDRRDACRSTDLSKLLIMKQIVDDGTPRKKIKKKLALILVL